MKPRFAKTIYSPIVKASTISVDRQGSELDILWGIVKFYRSPAETNIFKGRSGITALPLANRDRRYPIHPRLNYLCKKSLYGKSFVTLITFILRQNIIIVKILCFEAKPCN